MTDQLHEVYQEALDAWKDKKSRAKTWFATDNSGNPVPPHSENATLFSLAGQLTRRLTEFYNSHGDAYEVMYAIDSRVRRLTDFQNLSSFEVYGQELGLVRFMEDLIAAQKELDLEV
jgi:hypothetical protein